MKLLRFVNFAFWQLLIAFFLYLGLTRSIFGVFVALNVYSWIFFITSILIAVDRKQHVVHYNYLKSLGWILQPLELIFSIVYGSICYYYGHFLIGTILILGNLLSTYSFIDGKKLQKMYNSTP